VIEYLYQDQHLLVVNKPSGLLSVPGRGPEKQDCVWHRVQQQHPTARIVHRLDQATSGLMVLALTADSHRALSIQFQERIPEKRYQAVVAGEPVQNEGKVELPLRCDWERRPKQMVDMAEGKPALTHWHCIERYGDRSRVLLFPHTGRSHQLRVHMLALGHPILGDQFYAPDEILALAPRLLLHAEHLALNHPASRKWLEFNSACPF
jgi:tRNA pseudouridine32 synthase/23S rRNA pseudouridine746 synthase